MSRKKKRPSTEIFSVAPEEFPLLTPESRFRFSCQRCGSCCFDQLVLLEPQDLFRLSRDGGGSEARSTTDLLTRGWVRISFFEGRWRCFLAMPRWAGTYKCRFLSPVLDEDAKLRHWRCDLHERGAKPLVCSLSPVALAEREDQREIGQDPMRPSCQGQYQQELRLVAPVPDCPGMEKGAPYTLAEYIERSDLAERLALSDLFRRAIEPAISQDEALFKTVYDFDRHASIGSLEDLSRFMREVIGQEALS